MLHVSRLEVSKACQLKFFDYISKFYDYTFYTFHSILQHSSTTCKLFNNVIPKISTTTFYNKTLIYKSKAAQ